MAPVAHFGGPADHDGVVIQLPSDGVDDLHLERGHGLYLGPGGVPDCVDVTLSPLAGAAFAAQFGKLGERARPPERRPEGSDYNASIMLISNVRENGVPVGSLPDGEMWFHHDMCYVRSPHKATMLYGIAIPPDGGDTKFANMYRAYDQISEALKQELRGRTALQTYNYSPTEIPDVDGDLTDIHHLSQPIFVTNPESGRTALYVNRLMPARIDGMSKDESDPILEQLFDIRYTF